MASAASAEWHRAVTMMVHPIVSRVCMPEDICSCVCTDMQHLLHALLQHQPILHCHYKYCCMCSHCLQERICDLQDPGMITWKYGLI